MVSVVCQIKHYVQLVILLKNVIVSLLVSTVCLAVYSLFAKIGDG